MPIRRLSPVALLATIAAATTVAPAAPDDEPATEQLIVFVQPGGDESSVMFQEESNPLLSLSRSRNCSALPGPGFQDTLRLSTCLNT